MVGDGLLVVAHLVTAHSRQQRDVLVQQLQHSRPTYVCVSDRTLRSRQGMIIGLQEGFPEFSLLPRVESVSVTSRLHKPPYVITR